MEPEKTEDALKIYDMTNNIKLDFARLTRQRRKTLIQWTTINITKIFTIQHTRNNNDTVLKHKYVISYAVNERTHQSPVKINKLNITIAVPAPQFKTKKELNKFKSNLDAY